MHPSRGTHHHTQRTRRRQAGLPTRVRHEQRSAVRRARHILSRPSAPACHGPPPRWAQNLVKVRATKEARGVVHDSAPGLGTARLARDVESRVSAVTRSRVHGVVGVGLAPVGLVLLGACGRPAPSSAGGSGVLSDKVTAGTTCPVEQVGHPCSPRLVVADVQARAGTRVVASTRSGVDGSYRLAVPAGTYTLMAATGSVPEVCPGSRRRVCWSHNAHRHHVRHRYPLNRRTD